MSRIADCFAGCSSRQRTALIPYITAGDGGAQKTLSAMLALVESGADIIELGMPFSDPMADGPVIQKACERALEAGMTLAGVLELVKQFRAVDQVTPIVLMGYLNPLERYGHAAFAKDAAVAGVDGVLLVDCPPEEASGIREDLQRQQIDQIFLVAPTSTEERQQRICRQASGFVYYVSLKGVTGSSSLDESALAGPVAALRQHTDLPIAVGFGIKSAEDALTVAGHADAVVIGSALVSCLAQADDTQQAVHEFIKPIRLALDGRQADAPAATG